MGSTAIQYDFLFILSITRSSTTSGSLIMCDGHIPPHTVLVQWELDNYYSRPSESIAGLTLAIMNSWVAFVKSFM